VQLLKIRYLQAKRDLGYWVVIIAVALAYLSYTFASDNYQHNLLMIALVVFAIAGFQNSRRDLNFITKYFGRTWLQTSVNYNLSILPISFGFILKGEWMYVLLLHLLISFLPLLKIRNNSPKLLFIHKFIPDEQFEWLSGLRTNFLFVLVLAIAVLFFSPVKLFAIVALFVFNTVLVGFYGYFEPRLMLNPEQYSIKKFLSTKVKFFVTVILITNVPILIINSVFNPDVTFFNLFFLLGFLLLAACSIYIKYASYKPNDSLGFNMDYLILMLSIILPYLLLISVFIYFSTRKKAQQNLLNYLDDNS
jgi:hypothetical protein